MTEVLYGVSSPQFYHAVDGGDQALNPIDTV